ncbi:MAG: cytochrome b/b6 domain-containing protein [Geobacteraceae bacterium]|nr:cytochrome b/b6 domain-containing protein [Geobacteraceae bacterium]
MKPVLVWDIPTRLYHWLLAAGCLAAFGLAYAAPEHSKAFDAHMLLGFLLLPLLVFRILWGFVGTKHARFSSFMYRPGEVAAYLRETLAGKTSHHVGHNPAAGYAMIAMIVILIGAIASGILIPGSKLFEEVHETVSGLLLCLIAAHLLGVAVHMFMHRENVILSMVHGRKTAEADDQIGSSHLLAALTLLVVTGVWGYAIVGTYDYQGRKIELPLTGITLQLPSEKESETGPDDD